MFNQVTPLNIQVAGRNSAMHLSASNDTDHFLKGDDQYAYVEHAFGHYEEVLISAPHVWDWFKSRKINLTHPMISEFRIGFSDQSLCKEYGRDKGRQSDIVRGAWQRLGILKTSGYEYFHGDVIFPFIGVDDRIVGAYGRRITSENRPNRFYHHHWFYGDVTFFNIKALQDCRRVVLCKSPVEALVLISAGISNVISTMGLYSFGHAHLCELEKYQPSEVVLAFDNTDTGNHVAGLVAQALSAVNISCSRLGLPRNHDIGRLAQRQDHEHGMFSELIDDARPFNQSYESILGGV